MHPSLPVKSVQQLVALARAPPDSVDFGSAGHSTSTGLALDLFRTMADVKVTHIPYRGIGPVLVDTLAGQIQRTLRESAVLARLRQGGAAARACGIPARNAPRVLPELPTVAESGVPGYESITWHGWLAPAGTPAAIVSRLNAELAKERESAPTWPASSRPTAGRRWAAPPKHLAQHIATELARWRKVVKETGMAAPRKECAPG